MNFRSELEAEPWRFDLLGVLRRLERENPGKPRIGEARRLEDEFVEISQNPYLEFPDSNLEAAALDPNGRMRLKARFLGMFGPQGALPLTTTEEAHSGFSNGTTRFRVSSTSSSAGFSRCSFAPGRTRGRSLRTIGPTRIVSAPISAR